MTALAASCGGQSPAQPTPIVSVTSISPSSGPSIGGTAITVTGSNFMPGASLSIGGVSALNVSVIDSTMIEATTAPAPSGPADVLVFSAGRTAMLRGGFTYIKVENTPPVISSVTARGARPNEPSTFADLDEEINVTASVSDAETSLDQLTYEWSADVGTFIGSGPSVKWRAPRILPKTPVDYPLTLSVTEQYQTTDDRGTLVTAENKATGKVLVHVHNSLKEVSDLTAEFLNDFANSEVSAEAAVRNFSDSRCPDGKAAELNDVRNNRAIYIINRHTYGFPANVRFNFDGVCPFRSRPGDACIDLTCRWESTVKATGATEIANGTCQLTSVYEPDRDRWQLCWSEFRPAGSLQPYFPF